MVYSEITKKELENIMQLCKYVVAELSNDTDIKERLVNAMGTDVLLTAEEIGEEKGSLLSLIDIILKKIIKNKSLETIADEIEKDVEFVRPMYDIMVKNPGKTPEEIYVLLKNND